MNMKKKEKEEIKNKSLAELKTLLNREEEELVKAVMEKRTGKSRDGNAIRKKRDKLALIKTIIREKELGDETA